MTFLSPRIRPILKFALGLLLIFCLTDSPLLADRSLVVGPSRFDISLKPGESETYVVEVTNDGSDFAPVETLVEDLFVNPDGSPYYGPPSNGPHSCANWIRFNPAEFDLGPGQTQVVRFNVNVPETAVGSKYAVIFFRTLSKTAGSNSLGMSSKIGTIIVMDIPGTVPVRGDMTGLKVFPPNKKQADVDNYMTWIQMKNQGLAQFKVSGNIDYISTDKKTSVYSDHFDAITIVPGVTRDISIAGPKTLAKGTYKLKAEVEYINEIVQGEYSFKVD